MLDLWHDKFPKMATVIPDGASFGRARVTHLGVSEADFKREGTEAVLRSLRSAGIVQVPTV